MKSIPRNPGQALPGNDRRGQALTAVVGHGLGCTGERFLAPRPPSPA